MRSHMALLLSPFHPTKFREKSAKRHGMFLPHIRDLRCQPLIQIETTEPKALLNLEA